MICAVPVDTDNGAPAARARHLRRVRIHPDLSGELLRYLQQRVDVVASDGAVGELEVSILGSLRRSHVRRELDRRFEPWRVEHPDVDVSVVG